MAEQVLCERDGNIAIVTLNNPTARNALSRVMQTELIELFGELGRDAECRAIVLTGSGGHFCSGGDVSGMAAERTITEGRERVTYGHGIIRAIAAGPKPVIAAVEGFCVGAGLSLAVGSDFLVSSTTARYISACSEVGIPPDLGLSWSLPNKIGRGAANSRFAPARKVSAAEGKELGLVDLLVEPEQLRERAIGIAREFTNGAPLPMAYLKAAYARGLHTLEDALRTEADVQAGLYCSKD